MWFELGTIHFTNLPNLIPEYGNEDRNNLGGAHLQTSPHLTSLAAMSRSRNVNSKSGKRSSKHLVDIHIQIMMDNDVSATRTLHSLNTSTKISALKTTIEKDVGILQEMYMLTYLDASPLEDDSTLKEHFVVNGATFVLRPWRMWQELLHLTYKGYTDRCLACMNITGTSEWNKHCAWVALYISSHRGHYTLVAKILKKTKAAVNAQSPCGWTSLHAAARTGQWKVICVLVDNGANVRLKDNKQFTAFDLAREYGHKKCENSLNFCQWNLQKHYVVEERSKEYDADKARMIAERQAHLHKDSTLATWLRGTQGQLYMTQIQNPVSMKTVNEFRQEKIKSKVQFPEVSTSYESISKPTTADSHSKSRSLHDNGFSSEDRFDFNYGWFDCLRAQQLIPSTNDILTYANPSSNELRPRSLLNPLGFTTSSVTFPPIPTIHQKSR